MNWLKRLLPRAEQRRLCRYLAAGALTTVVSFGVLMLLQFFTPWDGNLDNLISVCSAMTFAFMINKRYVFRCHSAGVRELLREIAAFFSGRAVAMGLEIGGVWLLTAACSLTALWAKVIMNGLVLVLNYLLSRQVVFRL